MIVMELNSDGIVMEELDLMKTWSLISQLAPVSSLPDLLHTATACALLEMALITWFLHIQFDWLRRYLDCQISGNVYGMYLYLG